MEETIESQDRPRRGLTMQLLKKLSRLVFGEGTQEASAASNAGHWEAGKYEPTGASRWPLPNHTSETPLFNVDVFKEGFQRDESAENPRRTEAPSLDSI